MAIETKYIDMIPRVIDGLNATEQEAHERLGYTFPPDVWQLKSIGTKFAYIDCGTSGAFLMEIATGELYNIKGYGRPDYNKKKKSDIGNIETVDPKSLWAKRFNYLR